MKSIAVVGVGGIGGLLSVPLIRAYGADLTLVERGPRRDSLISDGLTLHSEALGELRATPLKLVEDASFLPPQDLILVCVKNTALAAVIESLGSVVNDQTTIVPVMNGVRAYARLQEAFPQARVLPAAIYTVSYLLDDHSIVQKGDFTTLHLGASTGREEDAAAAREVAALLVGAGVDCRVSDSILSEVWQKYILNCAFNVMDSAHDCTVADIKADKAKLEDYRALLSECAELARARSVEIPQDIVRRHLFSLMKTSDDSTSSLHRDFMARRRGEIEVFSGDVVRMAREAGVAVPVSQRYYEQLKDISRDFED